MNIISEMLLVFIDVNVTALECFDPYKYWGREIADYREWRKKHHALGYKVDRLISEGYIENNRKGYYVLTPKARNKLRVIIEQSLKLSLDKEWDGIWRVVVFDIPEEMRSARNQFRKRLESQGLVMLQKSVFCHPHDCIKEITLFSKIYEVEQYISYMEVTTIVTGKDIFKIFAEKGFIKKPIES